MKIEFITDLVSVDIWLGDDIDLYKEFTKFFFDGTKRIVPLRGTLTIDPRGHFKGIFDKTSAQLLYTWFKQREDKYGMDLEECRF